MEALHGAGPGSAVRALFRHLRLPPPAAALGAAPGSAPRRAAGAGPLQPRQRRPAGFAGPPPGLGPRAAAQSSLGAAWASARAPRAARAAAGRPRGLLAGPLALDEATVALHKAYHDRTIEFTMENSDWVTRKAYATDEALFSEEEQLRVWRASKARNHRWPRLEAVDMHEAPFGATPQRFCADPEYIELGDPLGNVFVISLMRRPTKLRRVFQQLRRFGISAKIVDAIDGDAFTSQQEIARLGAATLPGYCGHKNTLPHLTTGQLGCFMSHFQVWHYMVENNIQSAMILEDDFDLQDNFSSRLGEHLGEARYEDWNLLYLGRSPTEGDLRRASQHLVEPGYTLWTVGYLFRLDAAQALVRAEVQRRLAPLDHYFSIAMGRGLGGHWNEHALEWSRHIPQDLRGLAITPPLVMPYAGSMFLSDTAMFRRGTKFVTDLPTSGESDLPLPGGGPNERAWRDARGLTDP